MEPRDRNRFYSFWTIAIVLCFLLSIFALFFVACTDGSPAATDGTDTPAYSETQPAPTQTN